jgi:hypothetical protein
MEWKQKSNPQRRMAPVNKCGEVGEGEKRRWWWVDDGCTRSKRELRGSGMGESGAVFLLPQGHQLKKKK